MFRSNSTHRLWEHGVNFEVECVTNTQENCSRIHTHIRTYTRAHVHTHIYTRIHTHTHTFLHTHTHTPSYTHTQTHFINSPSVFVLNSCWYLFKGRRHFGNAFRKEINSGNARFPSLDFSIRFWRSRKIFLKKFKNQERTNLEKWRDRRIRMLAAYNRYKKDQLSPLNNEP